MFGCCRWCRTFFNRTVTAPNGNRFFSKIPVALIHELRKIIFATNICGRNFSFFMNFGGYFSVWIRTWYSATALDLYSATHFIWSIVCRRNDGASTTFYTVLSSKGSKTGLLSKFRSNKINVIRWNFWDPTRCLEAFSSSVLMPKLCSEAADYLPLIPCSEERTSRAAHVDNWMG